MKKSVFVLAITLILITGIGGCHEKETLESNNTLESASIRTDVLVSPEPIL
jgi:hypothetical protein